MSADTGLQYPWSATMPVAAPAERGSGYKGCLPFAWANRSIHSLGIIYGKENSGLVNVVLESRLKKSSYRKNGREGLNPVSKMALKKLNTNFRLEYSVRKTGLPFQMFRCCRKFTAGTIQWLMRHFLCHRIFRQLFVNGKQTTFAMNRYSEALKRKRNQCFRMFL